MSFIDGIMNFFTPKDGLYRQAEDVIRSFDTDRDNKVDLRSLAATGGGMVLNSPMGRTLIAADTKFGQEQGNGEVTIRELRSHMQKFDVGSPYDYDKGDKYLDAREMAMMLHASSGMGGYGGFGGYIGIPGIGGIGFGFGAGAGGVWGGGGSQAVRGASSVG